MTTRFFTIPETAETGDYRVRGALAASVFARDGGRCVYCGDFGSEIDHVRPASHFTAGTSRDVVNHPSNLVLACSTCNLSKGGAGIEGFSEKLLALGVSARKVRAMVRRVEAATADEE